KSFVLFAASSALPTDNSAVFAANSALLRDDSSRLAACCPSFAIPNKPNRIIAEPKIRKTQEDALLWSFREFHSLIRLSNLPNWSTNAARSSENSRRSDANSHSSTRSPGCGVDRVEILVPDSAEPSPLGPLRDATGRTLASEVNT